MIKVFTTFAEIENFFIERRKIGIKLGLDRVIGLLVLLENPERDLAAIHVAGTNGKGSTIQFLQNSLLASGYRVGVFTSPSFTGLPGHFIINDQAITDTQFVELFNSIRLAINKLDEANNHPTEYEILTVMAFVYFKDNVDIALIETAMGGKEDTTNCFIPLLSIITNVSLDHVDYLGHTIEEITDHKAGIIKEGRPVVIGKVSTESEAIIRSIAKKLDVPTYFYNQAYHVNGTTNTVLVDAREFDLSLNLSGVHQLDNASLVIQALLLLEQQGFKINWQRSITAINSTSLPGRFEVISQKPKIILDSAHNLAGIEAFIQTVEVKYATSNKAIVFSAFADKQFPEMISELKKVFNDITLTSFEHPRAVTLHQLASVSEENDLTYLDDWEQEITTILASKAEVVYFVTGSMHFITLVRNFILK